MTPDELIAETLRFDAEATKGPWKSSESGITQTAHITRDVWFIPRCEADMPLIAAYRTAAPRLARMLRVAMDALALRAPTSVMATMTLAEIERIAKEETDGSQR